MKTQEIMNNKFRLGVDIGGTFTDIVFLDTKGKMFIYKLLSTPDDYSRAIVNGIEAIFKENGLSGTNISQLVHGCTVATNTILERSAAPAGLITTRGFRDILEIRRYRIPEMYNLRWEKPAPLAPREFRVEVDERIDAKGNIITPLDIKQVEEAAKYFISKGVTSVAVCTINSYINPLHEQKIKEIIQAKFPDLWVTTSSDLLPLLREYERTSEVVVNAYVRPVVVDYLSTLTESIRGTGVNAPLLLMRSDGGMMSFKSGAEKPVYIIECGPAAGVIGSAYLAKALNIPNIITLDMGGTTTKASVLEDFKVSRASTYEVGSGISMSSRLSSGGGYVIRVASIDIAEIGAGGGSKIWVDIGNALNIGPVSAGSVPGPACYNQGGEDPALTDANLVLGYLNPDYLAGGLVRLNAVKAKKAIEQVAQKLNLDVTSTAYAAHVIGNANMTRAVSAVTTERGRDPRNFTIFAFGGAGPIHAVGLAHDIGIKQVVVMPVPGLFSALGLLFAEIEHTGAKTFQQRLEATSFESANEVMGQLKEKVLAEIESSGYSYTTIDIEKSVNLKYIGESSEISLPIPWDKLEPEHLSLLEKQFHEEHLRTFAHKRETEPVIMAILNVRAKVLLPEAVSIQGIRPPINNIKSHYRKAYFGKKYGWVDTSIIGMNDLPNKPQAGPTIVELYDSTCVIPPYCTFHKGPWNTIFIDIKD
jgi:N-methylhydantoinase A